MFRKVLLLTFFLAMLPVISGAQTDPGPEKFVQVEFGRSAEEYFNLGNWYANRDQHIKAVAYYKASLLQNKGFADAYINMGGSLKELGRITEAIDAYNKALELRTDKKFIYLNLGNALLAANKTREAILAFKTFVELEPYDPAGYARLGYALYSQHKWKEAVESFEKLLLINKEDSYFLYQAARCYTHLKDYKKTSEKAKEAFRIDPNLRFLLVDDEDFKEFRRTQYFRRLLQDDFQQK